jgi:hypothetical protein
MEEKVFVNGFRSWMETFFEVTSYINGEVTLQDDCCEVVKAAMWGQGYPSLYDLAEELTDEFEEINKGREWDGEFVDEINSFMSIKLDV